MQVQGTTLHRSREARGAGVASFGVIARTYNGVPADKIILDRRAVEDAAKVQADIVAFNTKVAHKVSKVKFVGIRHICDMIIDFNKLFCDNCVFVTLLMKVDCNDDYYRRTEQC